MAEVPQPQEPAPQEAAEVEVLQPPAQALVVFNAVLVAGLLDSGSGDRNLRTDPRSPSGAPSAAPSEGADTRGAIGAWSPTGAPKLNGAPTAAPLLGT